MAGDCLLVVPETHLLTVARDATPLVGGRLTLSLWVQLENPSGQAAGSCEPGHLKVRYTRRQKCCNSIQTTINATPLIATFVYTWKFLESSVIINKVNFTNVFSWLYQYSSILNNDNCHDRVNEVRGNHQERSCFMKSIFPARPQTNLSYYIYYVRKLSSPELCFLLNMHRIEKQITNKGRWDCHKDTLHFIITIT